MSKPDCVKMTPGATLLTRTPEEAHSIARLLVRLSTLGSGLGRGLR